MLSVLHQLVPRALMPPAPCVPTMCPAGLTPLRLGSDPRVGTEESELGPACRGLEAQAWPLKTSSSAQPSLPPWPDCQDARAVSRPSCHLSPALACTAVLWEDWLGSWKGLGALIPGLQLAKCEGSRLQVALSPGDGDTHVSSSALDPPLAPALGVVVTDLFVAPAHWERTLVTGSRPNLGRVL